MHIIFPQQANISNNFASFQDEQNRQERPEIPRPPSAYEQLAAADGETEFEEILNHLKSVYGNRYSLEQLKILAFVRRDRRRKENKKAKIQNDEEDKKANGDGNSNNKPEPGASSAATN